MGNLRLTLLMASFSFTFSCFSQVIWNEETLSARMEGIIYVEGTSEQDLYERSKAWMTTNIASFNELTVLEQDSVKQLKGSSNIILSGGGPIPSKTLDYNITIYIKEGRLKYVIQQLILIDHSGTIGSSDGTPNYQDLNPLYEKRDKKGQSKKDIQLLIDEKLAALINSLSKNVQKKISSETEGW